MRKYSPLLLNDAKENLERVLSVESFAPFFEARKAQAAAMGRQWDSTHELMNTCIELTNSVVMPVIKGGALGRYVRHNFWVEIFTDYVVPTVVFMLFAASENTSQMVDRATQIVSHYFAAYGQPGEFDEWQQRSATGQQWTARWLTDEELAEIRSAVKPPEPSKPVEVPDKTVIEKQTDRFPGLQSRDKLALDSWISAVTGAISTTHDLNSLAAPEQIRRSYEIFRQWVRAFDYKEVEWPGDDADSSAKVEALNDVTQSCENAIYKDLLDIHGQGPMKKVADDLAKALKDISHRSCQLAAGRLLGYDVEEEEEVALDEGYQPIDEEAAEIEEVEQYGTPESAYQED